MASCRFCDGCMNGELILRFQILQQMLNQPAAATNDLLTEPLEALEGKIDVLMKELRSRGTH